MEMNREQTVNEGQVRALEARMRIENQLKGGSGWFYWIAGLSLVNSIIGVIGKLQTI